MHHLDACGFEPNALKLSRRQYATSTISCIVVSVTDSFACVCVYVCVHLLTCMLNRGLMHSFGSKPVHHLDACGFDPDVLKLSRRLYATISCIVVSVTGSCVCACVCVRERERESLVE